MSKYSYEFKIKVVEEYMQGKGSYKSLAKKHNIPTDTTIMNWVNQYNKTGKKSLKKPRKNEEYSFQFKLFVVELYMRGEMSYRELALNQGIRYSSTIITWVNKFREGGPEALKTKKRGRKKNMEVESKKEIISNEKPDNKTKITEEEYKKVKEENLKLRIENAYLKELRRLRLEEETLRKKQRELSTVSEENSN